MTRLSTQSRQHPQTEAKQRMMQQTSRLPLRVSLQRGETHWQVEADLVDTLFDEQDLRLKDWLKAGKATIVKTGPHRTVYKLHLPEGRFYLKHYRIADWQAQLQNLFRPTKAELEWKAALRLIDLQINTFEPVALGKTCSNGLVKDSYLISREIENIETVQEFVQQTLNRSPLPRQTVLRRQLALELGRITARMHAGGLIHRDYHAGNLLVRVEPDQEMQLWLIDLHAAHTCRRLTLSRIEKNLSLLSHFFSHYSSKADRFRFIQTYWTTLRDATKARDRQLQLPDFPETVRRIESYCRLAGQIAFRKADRKWSRGNRRLIIADSPTACCRGIAELGHSRLEKIRENPKTVLSTQNGSDVVECTLDGMSVCGRLTEIKSRCRSRKTRFGKQWSPVRRAWEIGHAFGRRGIATPRPILFVEQSSGAESKQYLLTEDIAEAVSLEEWLKLSRPASTCSASRDEQQLIRSLAERIHKLHAFGFDHSQLTARNILVSPEVGGKKSAETYQVWLTSLEHVQSRTQLTRKQIILSLTQLNASLPSKFRVRNSLRMKFLKYYLGDAFQQDWKEFWRTGNSGEQR